ncbi:MAG: dehydrogenase [Omnitrophica WOR_2 bacterium RIFCSPHIGHO2_02_FULL_68_15]|nr:MAG: dehydrogenase [Omnitrophica WOR_2 bacterium RIFCSPHIGHO2_02_FULL_68_15]
MRTSPVPGRPLARVEGDGVLALKVVNHELVEARLDILEPPRFFEALLRGRRAEEAPDLTARICGICPAAYQMSAVHAIEDAAGVTVTGPLRDLRRLLICGEWIESHALHIYLLHAPDFLGYDGALQMAKDHPDLVRQGLRLKQFGNRLMTVLGGREIHPINVRLGGFYRAPTREQLAALTDEAAWALEAAVRTVQWAAALSFPEFEPDYEFVALRHPTEYPFNEGRLVSNRGLDIPIRAFEDHVIEEQVPTSHALQATLKGRGAYHVGPLARYSLNFDRLSPKAQEHAQAAGLGTTCRNPFKSILVRAVEVLYACEEALRILRDYRPPAAPAVPVPMRAATGYGCTEAPRGILYHRYRLDAQGIILDARLVPPTAQNQRCIEEDLRAFAATRLDLPMEQLTWQCEQVIRNYDPCISCATHFLRLTIERP